MDAWIDTQLSFSVELLILVRVVLSAALGFILGFERELFKRSAGLRTHILVCIASCLIMLVSIYGFDSGDPARLAAQAVSGIGFLGAGAIIKGDKGITGITTAATIWMSAMIGLSCGNGFYFGAILTTVCALLILTVLRRVEHNLTFSRKYKAKVSLVIKNEGNVMTEIRECLKESNLLVSDIDSKVVSLDKVKALKINITFERDANVDSLYAFISKVENKYTTFESKVSHE